MKWIKYITIIAAGLLLFSCVGEDITTTQNTNSFNFDRSFFSIASDEPRQLNLEYKNSDGELIDLNSEAISIEYSSNKPEVLTISDTGLISPQPNSIGKDAIVTITLTDANSEIPIVPIEDEILIGRVTISENEFRLIKDDQGLNDVNADVAITEIALEGYDPMVSITNPISGIDLNSNNDVVLNAIFQDFKREIVENTVFTWTSTNSSILDIDADGKLAPIAEGTAAITASASFEGNTYTSNPINIEVGAETVVIVTPPPSEREILGFGTFQSNSSYSIDGSFQIVKENGITTISVTNFATASLPDLVIYLSNNTDTVVGAEIISEDISATGDQIFTIPANVTVEDFRNVLLFCRAFRQRVGFGVINK